MKRPNPAAWPNPSYGDAWWNTEDDAVGTADYLSENLWYVRIRLQIRVDGNRVVDVRCTVEDDDSRDFEGLLASTLATRLLGRAVTETPDFRDAGFWSIDMPAEAYRDALDDWAAHKPERSALLPPRPKKPEPPRTLLSRLRGFLGV